MQKQYKNYVFDLYGTLVDVLTDEESQRLWTSFAWYLKLLGLPAEAGSLRADYLRLCAEAQRAKADMLMAKGIEGPYEADILTVWQALGNEKGMRLTIRQATEISRVFRALSLRRLGLFPGAAEVLGALRAAGKKVILLTNAQSGFTRPELHLLGLDTAFDAIFISGDAGVKKPSPAFFGLLWQTGLRPEDSVMVGNDGRCDCRGAAEAGMDSFYIHTEQFPEDEPVLPKNCHRIRTLTDLIG